MADDAQFESSAEPTLQQLLVFFADELTDPKRLARFQGVMRNAHAEAATVAGAAHIAAKPSLGASMEGGFETAKDMAQRAFGAALGWLVGEILGIEVSPSELFHARQDPEDSAVGAAIANVAFKAIRGPGGELEPGDEAAKRLLGTLAHIITHCWVEGIILEKVEHFFSTDGHIEAIAELAKNLVDTLGLNRAARMAIRPLVRAVVQVPHEWKVNKTFRPNLLSEGEILKAFARGDYTGDEAQEELARLGYSTRRQDMLVKSAAKRLSLDDTLLLARHGTIGRDYVMQNLRDEGFDQATAEYLVTAAETKRFDSFNDNSLASLTRAYVNREISDGALATFLNSIIVDDNERASFQIAAQTERELNVKHLSHGEVLDCVELGILPTAFYRAWLQREGYPDEEAFALELRLRAKLDAQTALDAHRTALEKQKAADQAARDEAARKRLDQLETERRLHRRGSIADLSRAVVRGLISIPRLEEVLNAEYDADTVALLVGLVEGDRQTYLAQQQAAADARQRASRRNVDVGALEQAVLNDVLTVQDFSQRVRDLNFTAADADVLTATLAAKKADRDAALAKRAKADQAATAKHIDLGRAERLVRRGHWTIAQYAALLASLDFDEPARAAMVDLLELDIADDAAARAARDAAAKKAATTGLSLEQFRRAVLIGVKTVDDFQSYLVKAGYTSEAQIVLVAELRRDVSDAEDARRRREAADAASGVATLGLSRVAQAARLGIISPASYQARLKADGYTADDIAIELELLLVEIADTQAARARRDALAAAATAPQALTLAQLERAVRAGTASINDYRLAAAAIYAPGDVELLSTTLAAELATLDDARARHTTITGELAARTLSIADLEAAVKAGALSVAGYRAQLVSWGYGPDDADLLTFLLSERLAAAPGGP